MNLSGNYFNSIDMQQQQARLPNKNKQFLIGPPPLPPSSKIKARNMVQHAYEDPPFEGGGS